MPELQMVRLQLQVEELALPIEDNLSSKHLVLSTEEMLVEFLQDNTRISHESVGEGDDRPTGYDHHQSLMPSPQLLRGENLLESKLGQTSSVSSSVSLEEREAAYLAARIAWRSRFPKATKCPCGGREDDYSCTRHRIYKTSLDTESRKNNGDFCLVEHSAVDPNCVESAHSGDVNEHPVCESNSKECIVGSSMEIEISSDVLQSEKKESSVARDKMEHLAAAKRMFSRALGYHRPRKQMFRLAL